MAPNLGCSMTYRLYIVSDISRRFEPAQELDAENDEAAIAAAETARAARSAELWRGSGLVKEWKD